MSLKNSAIVITTTLKCVHSLINSKKKQMGFELYGNGGDETYGQPPVFVHTFGTEESCSRNCPRQCVAQDLDDLPLMQRWICPTKVISKIKKNIFLVGVRSSYKICFK